MIININFCLPEKRLVVNGIVWLWLGSDQNNVQSTRKVLFPSHGWTAEAFLHPMLRVRAEQVAGNRRPRIRRPPVHLGTMQRTHQATSERAIHALAKYLSEKTSRLYVYSYWLSPRESDAFCCEWQCLWDRRIGNIRMKFGPNQLFGRNIFHSSTFRSIYQNEGLKSRPNGTIRFVC